MATKTRQLADFLVAGGVSDAEIQSVPHIRPGILQPAVAGKLLDGTTDHGSTYGVAQSDGHSYYYTDIKGSKPIKDPRIGAYFGSQRHKFKSIQLLEQETATHGHNISSIDGREWARTISSVDAEPDVKYDGSGTNLDFTPATANEWIEITGYFNQANLLAVIWSNSSQDVNIYIDGADTGNNVNVDAAVNSPLGNRYVDSCSVVNMNLGSISLGIHTIKIGGTTTYWWPSGIELIAQDTTSTANKSKIQIPAQNVISYGKKFAISATAQHYDPFNGMSGAKTLTELGTFIDTATSLGMENWKGGTSNYHKPFNGGRVVKWIANDGTIKTSVTMMPPNAQNHGGTASNAVSNAHIIAGTNDDVINFDTTTIANATPLSEVAKTFDNREFGNGAANAGTLATYADASMLTSAEDNIAYVMDDGLTSLAGNVKEGAFMLYRKDADSFCYATFIGTGITKTVINSGVTSRFTVAQNLPYGTHIFYQDMDSSNTAADWYIDGVKVADITGGSPNYEGEEFFLDMIIHQPKMPPIPEDACIISDYMLMADFVAETATPTQATISKGVRRISASRDWFYDSAGAPTFDHAAHIDRSPDLLAISTHSSNSMTATIPTFSTRAIVQLEDIDQADHGTTWAGTDTESSNTKLQGANNSLDIAITPAVTLGVNTIVQTCKSGGHKFAGGWVVSPIHTSSHYQTFETPFLNELVGGDRNMEQNNLIVTADGKSWDEVTRDTSYLGPPRYVWAVNGSHISSASTQTSTSSHPFVCRGKHYGINYVQKNWFPTYSAHFCLVPGVYEISGYSYHAVNWGQWVAELNGTKIIQMVRNAEPDCIQHWKTEVICVRGDRLTLEGGHGLDSNNYARYQIKFLREIE